MSGFYKTSEHVWLALFDLGFRSVGFSLFGTVTSKFASEFGELDLQFDH